MARGSVGEARTAKEVAADSLVSTIVVVGSPSTSIGPCLNREKNEKPKGGQLIPNGCKNKIWLREWEVLVQIMWP